MRDRAIALLPDLNAQEWVGLHWVMLLAGFPFFADLASNTGRLLSLQGDFTLAQLTRRMREEWVDRSTMTRATQRIMCSTILWSVLEDTEEKGVYVQSPNGMHVMEELAPILLETVLTSESGPTPINQAKRHPPFFPFCLSLDTLNLRDSTRFEILRQGLDVYIIQLARTELVSQTVI